MNSNTSRVSRISDDDDSSVSLDTVGVGRGISHIGGCFEINFVTDHMDADATIFVSVGVTFDVEAMRGIT